MNEEELIELVKKGETTTVEFKRELNLKHAESKAELVKDLAAIANSAIGVGYLIVGVKDDGSLLGTAELPEEQIQQIARTYVSPHIAIDCILVPCSKLDFTTVGVIVVSPTSKPHKVARGIAHVKQNDVYVRRGTVVDHASPEEIISMGILANQSLREGNQYLRAAETHLRLENFEDAVSAYSKAIEVTPSAEAFLGRANALLGLQTDDEEHRLSLERQALRDYGYALALAESPELNGEIRKSRYNGVRFYRKEKESYDLDERRLDFEASASELQGRARSEWMCDAISDIQMPWDTYAVETLMKIAESDPTFADAHTLLAEIHLENHNYGLAVECTANAISLFRFDSTLRDDYHKLLRFHLKALIEARRFNEASETLLRIEQENTEQRFHYVGPTQVDDLLMQTLLRYDPSSRDADGERHLIRFLTYSAAFSYSRRFRSFFADPNETTTELQYIEQNYPQIADQLKDVIGVEEWDRIHSREPVAFSLTFATE